MNEDLTNNNDRITSYIEESKYINLNFMEFFSGTSTEGDESTRQLNMLFVFTDDKNDRYVSWLPAKFIHKMYDGFIKANLNFKEGIL